MRSSLQGGEADRSIAGSADSGHGLTTEERALHCQLIQTALSQGRARLHGAVIRPLVGAWSSSDSRMTGQRASHLSAESLTHPVRQLFH
jgi:hypothetical protein